MEGFFAPFGILRWKMERIPLRNTHSFNYMQQTEDCREK